MQQYPMARYRQEHGDNWPVEDDACPVQVLEHLQAIVKTYEWEWTHNGATTWDGAERTDLLVLEARQYEIENWLEERGIDGENWLAAEAADEQWMSDFFGGQDDENIPIPF